MITQDAFPALSFLFVPARLVATRRRPLPEQGIEWGWSRADREQCAALLAEEGSALQLAVRTDAIVADLDLLTALDRCHAVTVRMLLAAVDEHISCRLEGRAPSPADRLRAVTALAAEGLDVHVVLTPVQPGINDGAAFLRRWMAAARDAGAADVEIGAAEPRRQGLAGRWSERPAAPHVRALFARLRLEHGFPRPVSGRG